MKYLLQARLPATPPLKPNQISAPRSKFKVRHTGFLGSTSFPGAPVLLSRPGLLSIRWVDTCYPWRLFSSLRLCWPHRRPGSEDLRYSTLRSGMTLPFVKSLQELGYGSDAGDQQMISGACTGDDGARCHRLPANRRRRLPSQYVPAMELLRRCRPRWLIFNLEQHRHNLTSTFRAGHPQVRIAVALRVSDGAGAPIRKGIGHWLGI